MRASNFQTLLALLCLIGAVASFPGENAPGLQSRAGQPYNVDLQAAATLQLDTSDKDAPDVLFTTEGGTPYSQPYDFQRIGADGPILLQDTHLIESLAHFDREQIPERVVHAKGVGAHGYFEVTNAEFAKNYTMMDVFSENGLRTPITIRFSTVGGEAGSADSARDPRGFAIKFRTRKGIWDLVMNNTPVFFIRDPSKFPHFIHTQKRNPQTHLKDKDIFWDYLSSNPESLYQVLRLFSDAGTPYGVRHMHGWSGHAYRWVKEDGSWVYVKIFAESQQGVRNFTDAEATQLAGFNPDFSGQDLFESIENGTYPGWTVYAQVLTPSDAEKFKYNVLDLTKDWGFDDVPRTEIGKFYLTENPKNYFAEIEQAAFSPARTVDGWALSADPVLQGRSFSYPDAHRYRLGVNYMQIPVNCPMNPVANFERDGYMNVNGNQGSRPNYLSTLSPIQLPKLPYVDDTHQQWTGGAVRSLSRVTEVDFDWPRRYLNSLSQTDKTNIINNMIGHLGAVKSEKVRTRQVALFAHTDYNFGKAIADAVGVPVVNVTFPSDGPTWMNTTVPSGNSTLNY
ncbi:catalase-domain-containing protein [Panus rudis PR-1116 ss-1]|nr:catalase-domain-containing protein [Panus rudis PR-1116 ss-1]